MYPDSGGDAVIGDSGFRASPSADLLPIEVPWSEVRSVKAGMRGGLQVRVRGGVIVLPGSASATVAQIIQRRVQEGIVAPA